MSKIKFGIAALKAAEENYQILLERLLKGYKKFTGKEAEGLDRIKIQQEAKKRAEDSAKVVDMEGRNLDPSKNIMGGTQDFEVEESFSLSNKPARAGFGKPSSIPTTIEGKTKNMSADEIMDFLQPNKKGGARPGNIDYDKMGDMFSDVVLYGDESFEELLIIEKTGKHPRNKADGGRIDYALGGLGGLTPTSQALGPLGSLGMMAEAPPVDQPTSGYGGIRDEKTQDALEQMREENPEFFEDLQTKQMNEIKGQTAGLGVVSALKGLGVLGDYIINQGRTKTFNKATDTVSDIVNKEKLAKQAAAAAVAQVARQQEINRNLNIGGYQSSFGSDDDFMSGSGTAAEMGSFAKGGLATMFVRKR
tara:strand:- start:1872 stop:2960 length:1089 start_codon:yes stop_codon:yes gene_type:complete